MAVAENMHLMVKDAAPSRRALTELPIYRRRRIVLAALCGGVGLIAVVAGWVGVSGTRVVSDQLAYIASGCVIGLALVAVAGALLVADHMVEQQAAIAELRELILAQGAGAADGHLAALIDVRANAGPVDDGSLVLVEGGRRVHRPSCLLVDGKAGLRRVTAGEARSEGLQACRTCEPDLVAAEAAR